MSRIAVVGLQHQGIILAAGFASLGHEVVGVDDDVRTIDFLNKGKSCLREDGLDELIETGLKKGNLTFSRNSTKTVQSADFIFLSFDLPITENGVDIKSIVGIAEQINFSKNSGSILCVTSQVPVGTSETLTRGPVAYIPELLRPGQSVYNFLNPDRIVIGVNIDSTFDAVAILYSGIKAPILRMSLRSAEMTKHTHNAILATEISFANEIAGLCKKFEIDVNDVMKGVKADSRVGLLSYLNPGWSLRGGHLIRDLRVLQTLGKTWGVGTPLLDAVMKVDEGGNL